MSSGISIEEGQTVESGESRPGSSPDQGFQVWHFFVLASILLATVAVIATRRSAPEHLVLLSFTVAAAGAVAAALYRMLLPLIAGGSAIAAGPMTERRRTALERDKMLALRAIKDLEFDRAMGKLSQKDFDEMSARLRQRAVVLMRELDVGASYAPLIEKELQERVKGRPKPAAAAGGRFQPAVEPQPEVCACGAVNDADAVFCKKCGTRLQAA